MFLRFLKNLLQLILSPIHGWEDISAEATEPATIMRGGLVPLTIVMALTGFSGLFYLSGSSFLGLLEGAILSFGAYFASIYVARLIFEMYLERIMGSDVNRHKIHTITYYSIGLMVLAQIIINCLPPGLNILRFIPIYVILVVYKSAAYMGVPADRDVSYLGLTAVATVAVPLLLYYILMMII